MSTNTIEDQLRSYGEDLAQRDSEGRFAVDVGAPCRPGGDRRVSRLVLVAALVAFVVGLGGMVVRASTDHDDTVTTPGLTTGPYLLPPLGSTEVQAGGDPRDGGSGIAFVDPHGLQWSLYTYDRTLMGKTEEEFRGFLDAAASDAAEVVEPVGPVTISCSDGRGVDGNGRGVGAAWASDTTMSFVSDGGLNGDRSCGELIADVRRMLGELRAVSQSEWLAFNASVRRGETPPLSD